jgi:glycosyltransferase involved in cell wall biosynthesis
MSARRPRVAWWSPLPPDPSGIADYAAELVPELAKRWDLTLFADGGVVEAPLAVQAIHDARDERSLAELHRFDAVLYHLGNNPCHASTYDALLRRPGLMVLHDGSLAHLVIGRTHLAGRTDRFFAEMRAQHGDEAAETVRRHFHLQEPAPWDGEPLRYPLFGRALASATAVLVHSRFVASLLTAAAPGLPVEVVEQHALPPPGPPPAAPVEVADAGRPIVFCTAGYLTPAKRIDVVLRALARLRGRVPFRYRLVGDVAAGLSLYGQVRDHGLLDEVTLVGRASQEQLYAELVAADVCVNLRGPTSGETSGMVQRALASGRPVVVNDVGWFSEIPDACAAKVSVGDDEVRSLARVLETLAIDADRRRAMSHAARAYAERLTVASRAAAYDAFVRRHAGLPGAAEAAVEAATLPAALALGLDAPLGALAADLLGPEQPR